MGTERRLPVSDAEVLAAYRAGESQRALAVRFKVSKGAVQKAIARAEACERSAEPSTPADSTAASGTRPMSSRDIRERLEQEAVQARDSRTRLNALKMLQELNAEPGGSKQSEAARNKQHLSKTGLLLRARFACDRAPQWSLSGLRANAARLGTCAG